MRACPDERSARVAALTRVSAGISRFGCTIHAIPPPVATFSRVQDALGDALAPTTLRTCAQQWPTADDHTRAAAIDLKQTQTLKRNDHAGCRWSLAIAD